MAIEKYDGLGEALHVAFRQVGGINSNVVHGHISNMPNSEWESCVNQMGFNLELLGWKPPASREGTGE